MEDFFEVLDRMARFQQWRHGYLPFWVDWIGSQLSQCLSKVLHLQLGVARLVPHKDGIVPDSNSLASRDELRPNAAMRLAVRILHPLLESHERSDPLHYMPPLLSDTCC